MCNPRRVSITATRELDEAWQHEVSRSARLSAHVVGQARVRQSLAQTLGGSALAALELALSRGDGEWHEVDGGYRHDVEGGYAVYHVDSQELEIVAERDRRVTGEETVSELLEGSVRRTLEAEGEGRYYDDEWGGHTEERARAQAEESAEAALEQQTRRQLEQARSEAEAARAGELEERARHRAQESLERASEEARRELAAQAAERLEAVGLRCRQAFHRLLARAYREALLSYARAQNADIVTDHDDGESIDIELRWSV